MIAVTEQIHVNPLAVTGTAHLAQLQRELVELPLPLVLHQHTKQHCGTCGTFYRIAKESERPQDGPLGGWRLLMH
jgi:hypothetical protein